VVEHRLSVAPRLCLVGRRLRQLRVVAPDSSWTLEPGLLLVLATALTLYVGRWRRARAEAGPRAASGWRLASFVAGLGTVFVALVSPVDRLGEQLFVMHMAQHLLVVDVAAILLTLGLTRVLLRPVTRRVQRIERRAGPLAHPAAAVILYVGGMWLWHVPALYDAALEHPALHALEHLTFAAIGLLYWWHLLSPIRSRHRLGGLGPVAYMFTGKIGLGLLGVLLTFSPDVLYDFYRHQARFWDLSALQDQSIGGAAMAIEQSLIMGVAMAWLFIRALGESEREEERSERYA
jgi:cytochrome c oxidase assembly factor CtaG